MWYHSYISQHHDVIIEAEGVQIEAHRDVLSELSSYFSVLFERWSDPSKLVYTIPGVAPNIMKSIIQYAYSKKIQITETSVQDVLVAADYLLVNDIIKRCHTFLVRRVCAENCREMLQIADVFSLDRLRSASLRFINNIGKTVPDFSTGTVSVRHSERNCKTQYTRRE